MADLQKLQDLQADIAQLEHLKSKAQRQSPLALISKELARLTAEVQKIKQNKKQSTQQQRNQPESKKEETPEEKPQKKQISSSKNYIPITKYSWQDESKKVKIYFSLDNIGNECTADKIDINFQPNSVQLKLRDYRKQNLIFSIKRTFGEIIPEQCKYLVKTNLLSITLHKKSTGTWTQLNYKQDKTGLKEKGNLDDPNASLMNMMKKLYEEGDENMKRTIAEAWTKSNDKKGKGIDL